MSFLLVVNRLDALINRIERLIAATTGVPVGELAPVDVALPEIVIPPPRVVISQPVLPNRYKLFRVDLTEVRSDEALGLTDLLSGVGALYASYMSIITVPSAFTFKLNSTDMDAVDAAVGLEMKDFEITEIFITNAALTGMALINVEYRVD